MTSTLLAERAPDACREPGAAERNPVDRNRILLVVHSSKTGGAERMALLEAKHLEDRFELLISVPDGPLRPRFAAHGELVDSAATLPLWGDSVWRWVTSSARTVLDAVQMAVLIRRRGIELVLTNSSVCLAPVLAARFARVPVVVHARDVPKSRLAPLVFALHGALASTVVVITDGLAPYFRRGRRTRIVTIADGIAMPSPPPASPPPASPLSASPLSASPLSASPLSASPLSASPLSASPLSASPLSASPLSASPLSASPLSASPLSASPLSASPLSASPLSASPLSASPLSASPLSASPLSASPLSASPLSASPLSASPLSASPLSASPLSASPLSASPLSASPLSASPLSASPLSASPPPGPPPSAPSSSPEHPGLTFHAPLRLCLIGGIDPRKGQDIAVAVLAQLRDRGVAAMLEFVGREVDREFVAAVRDAARRLGVEESIAFTGEVADAGPHLERADIVIAPSRGEWTPLVLMEALARGLPVVAARVGGVQEIVSDRESGLLVAPEDPAAMTAAILELLAQPAAAAEMARRGRDHVDANFRVERTLERLQVELSLLLGDEHGPTAREPGHLQTVL